MATSKHVPLELSGPTDYKITGGAPSLTRLQERPALLGKEEIQTKTGVQIGESKSSCSLACLTCGIGISWPATKASGEIQPGQVPAGSTALPSRKAAC